MIIRGMTRVPSHFQVAVIIQTFEDHSFMVITPSICNLSVCLCIYNVLGCSPIFYISFLKQTIWVSSFLFVCKPYPLIITLLILTPTTTILFLPVFFKGRIEYCAANFHSLNKYHSPPVSFAIFVNIYSLFGWQGIWSSALSVCEYDEIFHLLEWIGALFCVAFLSSLAWHLIYGLNEGEIVQMDLKLWAGSLEASVLWE